MNEKSICIEREEDQREAGTQGRRKGEWETTRDGERYSLHGYMCVGYEHVYTGYTMLIHTTHLFTMLIPNTPVHVNTMLIPNTHV